MTINKDVGDWYYRWSIEELREECKRKGLSTKGDKKELVERLGKGMTSPVKEPWQMTRKEYGIVKEKLKDVHYKKVEVWLAKFKGDPYARYSLAELEGERPDLGEEYRTLRIDHHELVKRAIEEGKSVPPEVLAEYPEIQ